MNNFQRRSFLGLWSLWLLLLSGCEPKKESITEVSHNMKRLGSFLDLEWVKPDSVAYVFKEVPQKNSWLSPPGPTDNRLEAVLYFGKDQLEKLRAASADSPTAPYFDKKTLVFTWLSEDLKQEIGDPLQLDVLEDQWFSTARDGVYVILEHAVLLVNTSR